jgi:hypothetical protein
LVASVDSEGSTTGSGITGSTGFSKNFSKIVLSSVWKISDAVKGYLKQNKILIPNLLVSYFLVSVFWWHGSDEVNKDLQFVVIKAINAVLWR